MVWTAVLMSVKDYLFNCIYPDNRPIQQLQWYKTSFVIPVQTHHCLCFLSYCGHCQDTVQRAIHIGDDLHTRETCQCVQCKNTTQTLFGPTHTTHRAIKMGHIESCILPVEYLSVVALKLIIFTVSFWLQPLRLMKTVGLVIGYWQRFPWPDVCACASSRIKPDKDTTWGTVINLHMLWRTQFGDHVDYRIHWDNRFLEIALMLLACA